MEKPEEYHVRLKKLEELRKMGIEPYPYSYETTHRAEEIKASFPLLEGKKVRVAGRIMSRRVFGKLIFSHIRDESGDIQIAFQKGTSRLSPHVEEMEPLKFARKYLDIGDIIGVEGKVFKTKTGEISVLAEEFSLLAKSLYPLPEKWHGLRDKELRYRERYLDFIVNPEAREVMKKKSLIISKLRNFLDRKGFLEFETPVLQPLYGGATARPFTTYSEALDARLYLRISDELYLKRLLVGGFERVYEISKDFRNEGIDRLHYPEFIMLEAYAAYWDYNDMMELAEELLTSLVQEIHGDTEIQYGEMKLSFKRPYKRVSFVGEIEKHLSKNPLDMEIDEIREAAEELGIPGAEKLPYHKIIDKIFDRLVGEKLINPTFVLDHPLVLSPLAKKHRENPRLVERFELFVAGMEVANAFSELNDPVDQRERFGELVKLRKKGDEELPPEIDEDFLLAQEHGMPPAGGIGIGVDRLVMILTDQPSIRDTITFPHLKPRS